MVHVSNSTHDVRSATHARIGSLMRIRSWTDTCWSTVPTGHRAIRRCRSAALGPDADPLGTQPGKTRHDGGQFHGLEARPVTDGQQPSLQNAVRGAGLVVNCAGPFLDTAIQVAAAPYARGHYYTSPRAGGGPGGVQRSPGAEMAHRRRSHTGDGVLRRARRPASDRRRGRLGNQRRDHRRHRPGQVWPTEGTRNTGRRNTATRLVVDGGRLVPAPSPAPLRDWEFPAPLGRQTVTGNPFTEIITMAHHQAASRIDTYLTTAALQDIRNPAKPAPPAVDEAGCSAQQFVVDVVVRPASRSAGSRLWARHLRRHGTARSRGIQAAHRRSREGAGRLRTRRALRRGDLPGVLSPHHSTIHREGPRFRG